MVLHCFSLFFVRLTKRRIGGGSRNGRFIRMFRTWGAWPCVAVGRGDGPTLPGELAWAPRRGSWPRRQAHGRERGSGGRAWPWREPPRPLPAHPCAARFVSFGRAGGRRSQMHRTHRMQRTNRTQRTQWTNQRNAVPGVAACQPRSCTPTCAPGGRAHPSAYTATIPGHRHPWPQWSAPQGEPVGSGCTAPAPGSGKARSTLPPDEPNGTTRRPRFCEPPTKTHLDRSTGNQGALRASHTTA
jgi:hypothetical protein